MISIIVPVFNEEKYLSSTIESVLKQDSDDWELLLINDGSKDASGNIVDYYAQKSSKIFAIHQDNLGVSNARNHGLRLARGEYILFLDSDDYLEPNAISSLNWEVQFCGEPDLIVFGIFYTNAYGDFSSVPPFKDFKKYNLKLNRLFITSEIIPEQLNTKVKHYDILPYVTNKLYKKEKIKSNSIKFDENYLKWEDKDFVLEYLQYANSISFLNKPLYHYCNRTGTLSQKFDENLIFQLPDMYKNRCTKFEKIANVNTNYAKNIFFNEFIKLYYEYYINKGLTKRLLLLLQNDIVTDWAKSIEKQDNEKYKIAKAILQENYGKAIHEIKRQSKKRRKIGIRRILNMLLLSAKKY